MKIAIFHELHAGGARRTVNEFAKRLKKNHTVDLYYVDSEEKNSETANFTNTNFYKFTPLEWSGGDWTAKLYKDTFELFKLQNLHKQIAHDIDLNKYDLAFIHPSQYTQTPFILKYLATKKTYYCQETLRMAYEDIFRLDNNLPFIKYYYEKLCRQIRKKIDSVNIQHADKILANSKYTQSNIKKAYGLDSTVAYLGVDTSFFKPLKIKKNIDILFLGSLDNIDGYDLLKKIENKLDKNINIKILAQEKQWKYTDEYILGLYSRSRIVLCLSRNEPFGLIPLEAMSCAIPVIALYEGGYKETIIDDQTGYLMPPNPRLLADKINYLLSSPALIKKISIRAESEMKTKWDWDIRTFEIEKIFQLFSPPA